MTAAASSAEGRRRRPARTLLCQGSQRPGRTGAARRPHPPCTLRRAKYMRGHKAATQQPMPGIAARSSHCGAPGVSSARRCNGDCIFSTVRRAAPARRARRAQAKCDTCWLLLSAPWPVVLLGRAAASPGQSWATTGPSPLHTSGHAAGAMAGAAVSTMARRVFSACGGRTARLRGGGGGGGLLVRRDLRLVRQVGLLAGLHLPEVVRAPGAVDEAGAEGAVAQELCAMQQRRRTEQQHDMGINGGAAPKTSSVRRRAPYVHERRDRHAAVGKGRDDDDDLHRPRAKRHLSPARSAHAHAAGGGVAAGRRAACARGVRGARGGTSGGGGGRTTRGGALRGAPHDKAPPPQSVPVGLSAHTARAAELMPRRYTWFCDHVKGHARTRWALGVRCERA